MNGNLKRSGLLATALLVCVGLSPTTQGASFDCGKAQTMVEHMICDNPEISQIDDELSVAYKAALKDHAQAEVIKRAQKQWMKERNNCADEVCVKTAYQQRIEQLQPAQAVSAQQTDARSKGDAGQSETACLPPLIDWRNYQWTLISGKGETICEEMLAYLKSRPADAPPPTCPQERLPQNGNWTRPVIRDLGDAEKQHILQGIPERHRQKDKGDTESFEWKIRNSKLLRVVRGDITHDGAPEAFLAMRLWGNVMQTCERATKCALKDDYFNYEISLNQGNSDAYELLPMNDEGTDVNWSHRTIRRLPILFGGELVYFRGQPYWMTYANWFQREYDNFARYRTRPDDSNSKIFGLYGIGHYVVGQYGGPLKPAPFSEVQNLRGVGASCEFGYFHRDNLKLNAIRKGR